MTEETPHFLESEFHPIETSGEAYQYWLPFAKPDPAVTLVYSNPTPMDSLIHRYYANLAIISFFPETDYGKWVTYPEGSVEISIGRDWHMVGGDLHKVILGHSRALEEQRGDAIKPATWKPA